MKPIITIYCKTISPMFSGNANTKEAELRPSAFIGALRFWWRAIHPNLPPQNLIIQEKEFFGGRIDDKTHHLPSFRFLEIKPINLINKNNEQLDARDNINRGIANAIMPNSTFTIKLQILNNEAKVIALFKLASALGGIGKRSRRGAGAWKIESINNENTITYDKESITQWISIINPNYEGNIKPPKYPYLKNFEIGTEEYDNQEKLRKKIMETAHSIKISDPTKYIVKDKKGNDIYCYPAFNNFLGKAEGKKRLASPVYVSIIKSGNKVKPIISKLGLSIDETEDGIKLQNKFINCIVNNSDC